jgi:TPR repeat protein
MPNIISLIGISFFVQSHNCAMEDSLCFDCPKITVARSMYSTALKSKDYHIIRKAGEIAWECEISRDPLPLLKRAAEMGTATDAEVLGTYYQSLEKYPDAVAWFEKASNRGSRMAKTELVEIFLHGETGIPANHDKALELLEQLSWMGSVHSMIIFSNEILNKNNSNSINRSQAIAWLRTASRLGPQWIKDQDKALLFQLESELTATEKEDLKLMEADISQAFFNFK